MTHNIHVIAEAGTNHNGQLIKARRLAAIARDAGATSVKYQIIYPWGLYLPGEYDYGHYDIKEVIKIREEGVMSDEDYDDLAHYCRELGIQFSASVFDPRGLELLLRFDPPYIKIASCDLNNLRFLREVAEKGKKIVLSTGMSSLADIEKSVRELDRIGFRDLVLMHCVSVYPATLSQMNLSMITVLRSNFGFEVGFSDHTGDSLAACIALSLGATWFEKHFTEDRTQRGLDHAYAMEEAGLKMYIQELQAAYTALQPQEAKISEAERLTRRRARRSLYAARDLPAGHVITNDDVLCVRPENVMQADEIDLLIGKALRVPVHIYQPFRLDDLA